MAAGALPWQHAITHRVAAENSAKFYDAINRGEAQDVVGAVLRWA